MKLDELHWLAGLLEGEGCFRFAYKKYKTKRYADPVIVLRMTDRDVVARAAALMGTKSIYSLERPPWKKVYDVRIHGRKAEALMRTLLPLMGRRRQKKISSLLANLESRRGAKAARIKRAYDLRNQGMIFSDISKTIGARSHVTAMRLVKKFELSRLFTNFPDGKSNKNHK